MNIWSVALKELKMLRDVKNLLFMLLVPIVFILLLGTMLVHAFQPSTAVGEIRLLYKLDEPVSEVSSRWEAYAAEAEQAGVSFERAGRDTVGISAVELGQFVGYVEVSASGLHYFGNEGMPIENGIALSYLAAFVDRYKLVSAIAELSPSEEQQWPTAGVAVGLVQEATLDAGKRPDAMDYYAIAMITLIVLYSSLTAVQTIDTERKRGTAARMLVSPIKKTDIFAGKLLGLFLVNAVSTVVVILICKYMFHIYWGEQLALVIAVIFTEVIFALSLGLGCSYLFKGQAAGAVVMIIIQVGAFLGGSYFPLDTLTGTMRTITYFSPLTWTNDALLEIIYVGNSAAAASAAAANLGGSVLLLGAALLLLRKREGL